MFVCMFVFVSNEPFDNRGIEMSNFAIQALEEKLAAAGKGGKKLSSQENDGSHQGSEGTASPYHC